MSRLPALGISIVLLVLNGFFVAVEFALLASRRARLNHLHRRTIQSHHRIPLAQRALGLCGQGLDGQSARPGNHDGRFT